MKNLIKFIIGFIFAGSLASAQTTTVTATVVDSDSTVWANGTWSAAFVPNPSIPQIGAYQYNNLPLPAAILNQSGTMNGAGFLSVVVYQSSAIVPAGSGWILTVCPNASTQCGSTSFAAVGATMDLSSVLSSVIPAPRFKPIAGSFGYNNLEAQLQVIAGSMYWNVTTGNLQCYNNVSLTWVPCNGTSSPFTINSFTGCSGLLELGQSVVNPTCNAAYSSTPSSASISNTDGIDSPLSLVSPFTSGTIVGTFSHSSITNTTFTLTAVGSSTQMASQNYNWKPRIFGGVGASGATSTVTASGNTAILSNSSILSSAGLGAETVGQIIGNYSTSGQNVYLLLIGGTHTFIDANTGFPFAFNAPITVVFVNQYGVTVTMYLYQSTNSLFGNYAPKVAS